MTIFLTTHYMDEADSLCDRIAIIDYGQIKALDTPSALKSALGGDTVTFCFDKGSPEEITQAVDVVRGLTCVSDVRAEGDTEYLAVVSHGESVVPEIFESLMKQPARIGSISVKRPSLDEVFLYYTGRKLRDTESSGGDAFQSRMTMRRLRG